MQISSLRNELQEDLANFAWSQWGQMGVLASSSRADQWVADPEALLLLSFEVGREEPRLFDEVLDWLLVNERLVSLQRLRNLCKDQADRELAGAVADWLSQWRRKSSQDPPSEVAPASEAQPLFFNEKISVRDPDPCFLQHGFLKSWTEPTRRSGRPNLELPVNLALRTRSVLGVGTRAEVVRILLTTDAPVMSLQAIAAASGFAKRNVQEAATALRQAGVATSWTLGNEQRFEVPRERWLYLFSLERPPVHRDWPQLFRGLRVLLRWLREASREDLSDYMRASDARAVVEDVSEDFLSAGTPVDPLGAIGEEFSPRFEAWVRALGRQLAGA